MQAEPSSTPDLANPVQPTAAAEWPKEVPGQLVTLPSGAVARVAKPPFLYLVATDRVPARIRAILKGFNPKDVLRLNDALKREDMNYILDYFVAESFLEPKVSMQPAKGCLHVKRIDDRDKEAIIELLDLRLQ